MNRRLSISVATAVIALSSVAACGGGGGGGSSYTPPTVTPTPATTPTPSTTPTPTAPPFTGGFIVATGPITELSGASGGFGSTITNAANTAVFLAQSAATPDSVVGAGTLASSSLTMSETGGQSTQSRARFSHASQRFVRDADFQRRPDLITVDAMRTIARSIRHTAVIGRSAQSTRTAAANTFAPGSTFTFQLQGGNISGTSAAKNLPVPAHLITQTAHANVWLDDSDAADPAQYPSGIQADMNTVAARFEENFTTETAAFGPAYTTNSVQFQECDANGTILTGAAANSDPGSDSTAASPRINIIITTALAGTGEGGYFFGADEFSQSEVNCIPGTPKIVVNSLKMIVVAGDKNTASPNFAVNNEAFWLQETAPQTLAHEFQHFLHFTNKYFQQIVNDPSNSNAGTIDNSFIDEGCSVLAQDLVVAPNNRDPKESETALFVRLYLLEPDLYSLTSFSGYQPDPASSNPNAPYGYYHNNGGNYGFSYLFLRYLYDRFPGALQRVYAEKSGGATGIDVGPATSAANGEPFAQLYQEFATALAVHAGGGAAEITTDPRFTFSSALVLRGLTQTYSRRISTNVRNIVQPGPENPEVFSGNQPVLDVNSNSVRQTLTPGQTITLKLISGATIFATATGTPSTGGTVRVNGATANLQGALGQGPIPTPTPAYF